MYKDKDRQREAQREWVRQKRASKQGSTEGSTKRGLDIKCFEDLPVDVQQTIAMMSTVEGKINQTFKANRTAIAIHYQHVVGRYEPQDAVCTGVATGKPGDADYNGICTEEWRQARGR